MIIAKFVYVILVGYLLGAIPWGVIISRRNSKVDIRQYGSGKTGTTNVLRTSGSKAAATVLFLDLMKGSLAVIVAGLIFGNELLVVGDFGLGTLIAQVIAALAAVAGHNWSVFLGFRGGRGVATFFGGLAALCPPAAIVGGEVFVVSAGFTRYASLGSILGAVSAYVILVPLTIIQGFPLEYILYALIGGLVIIVMHRDNINRLVAGTELKIGQKALKADSEPPRGTRA
jgi:acyl phosphate:glycerol-3-phosphate acyltransferase